MESNVQNTIWMLLQSRLRRMGVSGWLAVGAALVCAMANAEPAAGDPAARGLEVARRAHRAHEGFGGERAAVTLEIANAHGETTTRKLRIAVLEGKADGDRSLLTFEWPADVKGTKLLTFSHRSEQDDQWLYLPAIKRVRRIAAAARNGSFMGSEFSYEDFASQEVEKFTYRWLDETKEAGRDCDRVERVPVERSSGYSREVVWIDKEYLAPMRIDYHDRGGALLKVARFSGYRRYGADWRWNSIAVENVQTKKHSTMTWVGREIGVKLEPSRFDSAALDAD